MSQRAKDFIHSLQNVYQSQIINLILPVKSISEILEYHSP